MTTETIKHTRGKHASRVHARCAFFVFILAAVFMSGCTGVQTFSQTAFPGDTVGMAIGRQSIKRNKVTIVVTDSSNFSQSFSANDPLVRAWFNVYPDPVSRLIVGRETGNNLNTGAWVWGVAAEETTGINERDIYDTIVMIDLPANLSAGLAQIDMQDSFGTSILAGPATVNVLAGTGAGHPFDIWEGGTVQNDALKSMGRGKHYEVNFSGGAIVPAAIQVNLSHNPDRENGGVGQAYVASPRGDITGPVWTDDGMAMRVILTHAWQKSAEDLAVAPGWQNEPVLSWFKFYVAGDITGLQVDSVSAFDVNGNSIPGVSAAAVLQ